MKQQMESLDEDSPLWLINEQIKGLLEGDGADEDHTDVQNWLRYVGLPDETVRRMHKAIVFGDSKITRAAHLASVNKLLIAADEWSLYVVEDCAPITLVDYLKEAIK